MRTWLRCISPASPGQIHLMPRKYLFLTTLPMALCFFLQCGSFRNDSEGIYVHDRMYQVPLRKDIWDAGKKRVNARNGMVIAGTGGGKSAFTLNLAQQLIEQDYTVVVVEFERASQPASILDISPHVDYDGRRWASTPLRPGSELNKFCYLRCFSAEIPCSQSDQFGEGRPIHNYYENVS